jgi:hypothetical protein
MTQKPLSYPDTMIDSIRVDGTRVLADGTPGDGRSRCTRDDGLGALATGGHGCGRRSFVDHGRM